MSNGGRVVSFLRRTPPSQLIRFGIARSRNVVPFELRLRYRTWKNGLSHPPKAVADPLKLVEIDPASVVHDGKHFTNIRNIGTIKQGEWDLEPEIISEKRIFQGLHERFVDGQPWEETDYWSLAVESIEEKGWFLEQGYTSLQDIREYRLPYLDSLYESIASEGYRTQDELDIESRDTHRHPRYPDRHRRTHEVGVSIARDGEVLLNSGIHRLCMAKFAGLDVMPVLVVVRHAEWQRTRDQIVNGERKPFSHPDLLDLTEVYHRSNDLGKS